MPRFIYKAKSGPKDLAEGIIEAENKDNAITKLNQLGYFPVSVVEEGIKSERSSGLSLNFFSRIAAKDVGIFTRRLSDLLDSGLTILRALDLLYNQTENKNLKEVIQDVSNFVRGGGRFSEALARHPNTFSNLYTSMVKSGETGGMLDAVLNHLADFAEKEEEVRGRISASMAYPILLALLGTITIFILLTFVIPRLVNMFMEIGQALPLPTIILINVSNFFANYWWLILTLISIIVFLIRRRNKTREGRYALDIFKLNFPVLGDFIKKTEIARFARTLGTLLQNGVPIIESLDGVSEVMGNEILRRETERMRSEVVDGSTLSKAMSKAKYFPEFVTNMIAVGEEGGQLEKSLSKVADSYERESDKTVKLMTSLLEPIMILIMGSIVGFIVISMLLPIFQINLAVR